MMTTIVERFDGVDLIRPLNGFVWPHPTFDGFPECCGAGPSGSIGQEAVPETILGLDVSPACCVHDFMFTESQETWQNFHYANAVFLVNLLQINRERGGNWLLKKIRGPVILAWFAAVSSAAGAGHFFNRRVEA